MKPLRPEDMLDLPPMAEKPPGLNYKLAEISDPSRISVTKIRWNMGTTNWLAGIFDVKKKSSSFFHTQKSPFFDTVKLVALKEVVMLYLFQLLPRKLLPPRNLPCFFVGERYRVKEVLPALKFNKLHTENEWLEKGDFLLGWICLEGIMFH